MVSSQVKQNIADTASTLGGGTAISASGGGIVTAFVHEYYSMFMLAVALGGLITQAIATYYKIKFMKNGNDNED